jgi:hypothetical protein
MSRRNGLANEIVIFAVGSRSAVSIPCEENFILAKNLPLDGTKLGSSLLSMEGLLGHSPPREALWPSGTAGGQAVSGAQIGFWVFRLLFAQVLNYDNFWRPTTWRKPHIAWCMMS